MSLGICKRVLGIQFVLCIVVYFIVFNGFSYDTLHYHDLNMNGSRKGNSLLSAGADLCDVKRIRMNLTLLGARADLCDVKRIHTNLFRFEKFVLLLVTLLL